jgi:hypothetical protein
MRGRFRMLGVMLGLAIATPCFGNRKGPKVVVQSEVIGSVGLSLNDGETVSLAGRSTISLDLKSGRNQLSLWSCGWPDCRWITYDVKDGQTWLVAREGPDPRVILTKKPPLCPPNGLHGRPNRQEFNVY